MIPDEVYKMKYILDSFLGDSKSELSDSYQLEYPCPRCVENKGKGEIHKYNLSVSLSKQVFQCWSCVNDGDDMHGSILKLIKLYGNDELLKEYKDAIKSLRASKLYKLQFTDDDFNIDTKAVDFEELNLPKCYRKLKKGNYIPQDVINYLSSRGIGWDIIERYNIGYTAYCDDSFMPSYRVYIPSYNEFGELNYWTGRDYRNRDKVVKYYNPNVERKSIIFNEEKVQWDADITLVEGPFDHIVVPNSIPLLGKALNNEFKLYWDIIKKANANINIWLDGDAYDSIKEIYKKLNHDRLYNKIRIIASDLGKDPSEIYQKYGYKGIIYCLQTAKQIPEIELQL